MPDPHTTGVSIRGTGVAAFCSAFLLDRAGVAVTLEEFDRPRVPAIMIGEASQRLIGDVFEQANVFEGLHRITKRVVAWGPGVEPKSLPHSAVVISEPQLAERLRPSLSGADASDPSWTIFASRPLPPVAVERRFGSRLARAALVQLKKKSDPSSCWIESLENGWLFLIPNSVCEGYLLSVGDVSLDQSRLIAPEIDSAGADAAGFPAYPRIIDPLCSGGWLACGTAAMAFDPICGDGTGNAVREAILAAAVIRADGPIDDRLDHYRMRLLAGFLRHLDQCRQFYSTGHSTDWWRAELEEIRKGIEWCQAQLGAYREFRYQLRGFELEPISPAARV